MTFPIVASSISGKALERAEKRCESVNRQASSSLIELGSSAVITRNAYGARALNTDNLMFIDLDQPAASSAGKQPLECTRRPGSTYSAPTPTGLFRNSRL